MNGEHMLGEYIPGIGLCKRRGGRIYGLQYSRMIYPRAGNIRTTSKRHRNVSREWLLVSVGNERHGVAIVVMRLWDRRDHIWQQCECGEYVIWEDITTLETLNEWYRKHLEGDLS